MAGPKIAALEKNRIPNGPNKEYIEYLINLPEGKFWDSKAFQRIPNYKELSRTQPTTVWLRFFDLLKNGRELEAAQLLVLNPFQSSFLDPDLEIGFRRVLNYRLNGTLSIKRRKK